MTVCSFFLQGRCRYGEKCWNEHPRDGRGGDYRGSQQPNRGGETHTHITRLLYLTTLACFHEKNSIRNSLLQNSYRGRICFGHYHAANCCESMLNCIKHTCGVLKIVVY